MPMQMYHLKNNDWLYGNQVGSYKYETSKRGIAENNKHIPYVVVDKEGIYMVISTSPLEILEMVL